MYLDKLGEFSDAQALAATGNGTNVIDLGNPTVKRQIGAGKPLWAVFTVDTAADHTTGDETYQFDILTDSAANLGTATSVASRAIAAATLVAGFLFAIAVPLDSLKEFLGVKYTLGGTTPSVTMNAFLTDQEPPVHTAYASGTTQAV